jgi:hypothetical protein
VRRAELAVFPRRPGDLTLTLGGDPPAGRIAVEAGLEHELLAIFTLSGVSAGHTFAREDLGDLAGAGQLAWLDRLETEHDNLWAAMSWLAGHGPLEQAVHLITVAWRFWWLRSHPAELARLGDDLVAGSKDLPPCQRAGRWPSPWPSPP